MQSNHLDHEDMVHDEYCYVCQVWLTDQQWSDVLVSRIRRLDLETLADMGYVKFDG